MSGTIEVFGSSLTYIQVVVYLYIAVYGLSLGIPNTLGRIGCILCSEPIRQSTLGKVLDALWCVLTITAVCGGL